MKYDIKTTKLVASLEAMGAHRINKKQYEIPVDPVGQYPRYHITIQSQRKGVSHIDIHIDMVKHNWSLSRHWMVQELFDKIKNKQYVTE